MPAGMRLASTPVPPMWVPMWLSFPLEARTAALSIHMSAPSLGPNHTGVLWLPPLGEAIARTGLETSLGQNQRVLGKRHLESQYHLPNMGGQGSHRRKGRAGRVPRG